MDDPIADSQHFWDAYALTDPLFAVLSDPAKRNRRWHLQEFMKNGEREISLLMYQLSQLRIALNASCALDFGCGVGRLTQALARRFSHVVGIDVSPAMIDIASRLNRYPSMVEYRLNGRSDLRILASRTCDFIYSNIVLQHIPPTLTLAYLAEFFRVLKPGGVLVFQLPSHQNLHRDVPIRPMPNAAYRATVRVIGAVPAALAPKAEALIDLEIVNASDHEWRQSETGSIRAGNHWLDASDGGMLVQDDGRTALPQILAPGETCRLGLTIRTPAQAGTYTLAVDVVHEAVTWFEDKGSHGARVGIRVAATGHRPSADAPIQTEHTVGVPKYADEELLPLLSRKQQASQPGKFPMYGVTQSAVLSLVRAHKGTVVHVEEDGGGGPEWMAYRYFVTAP